MSDSKCAMRYSDLTKVIMLGNSQVSKFKKLICVKINLITVFIFCNVLSFQLYSQASDKQIDYNRSISFPSPNAAALGKFGFIPINYSTGVPNVTIPIWNIQEQELSLPVSLSYNNNGLRVSEEASWVGFGWTLTSGGAITRTVHGAPDIEGTAQMNNNNGLKFDQLGNPGYIDDLTANRIAEGYYDGEPDMFVFNFAGYSGKFILYQNQAKQLTYSDLRILKVGDNFTITTDEGIIYEFAKREQTLITSSSVQYQLPVYTSAWLLTSITSANQKEIIEFVYSANTENISPNSNYDVKHSFEGNEGPYVNGQCADLRHSINNSAHTIIYSWRLERIKSKSLEIEFKPQGSDRLDIYGSCKALDEINIYPKGSSIAIHKFKFNYDYFGSNTDKNYARLKLTNLIEYGSDSNTPKSHIFEYYEGSFPSKVGYEMDHWGYYNGSGNTSLVPHLLSWQNYGDANREPNSVATNGMLKKIIYPTKGYSSFSYTQNQYTASTGTKAGPGMRVSQIQDYDGEKIRYVNYAYENALFFGEPIYINTYTYYACVCLGVIPESGGCSAYGSYACNHYVITGENTSLYAGLSGFSLAYQKVIESIGLNSEMGKTEYIFEPSPQYDLDHEMKLKETVIKSSSGIPIRKIVNTNNFIEDQNYNAFSPQLTSFYEFCNPDPSDRDPAYSYVLNDYNIDVMYFVRSYWHYVSKTIETEYDVSGTPTLAKETNYKYNSTPVHRYPTRIEENKSNGEVDIQFFKYPRDYATDTAEGSDPFYNAIKKMKGLNINSVIEAQTIRKAVGGQEMITDAKIMLHKTYGADNNIQLSNVLLLETNTELSLSQSSTSGNTLVYNHLPYNNRISYDYEESRMKLKVTNNSPVAYAWGYNKTLPIAEVKNALDNSYTTTTTEETTASQSLGGINNTSHSYFSFTVEYQGDVTLKLGSSDSYSIIAYYSGVNGSDALFLSPNQGCGYDEVVFSNVPPGNYTLDVLLNVTETVEVSACGELEYPVYNYSYMNHGSKEFFLEDFEESTQGVTAQFHTGKKSLTGDYVTTFVPPNARAYNVEYWYLDGSQWKYASKPYTGANMVLNEGSAIDNVRIYPTDAFMKSYTYEPLIGLTSAIDERGTVLYYDYDTFGRLWRVRNDKGGIEKQFTYNYKTN